MLWAGLGWAGLGSTGLGGTEVNPTEPGQVMSVAFYAYAMTYAYKRNAPTLLPEVRLQEKTEAIVGERRRWAEVVWIDAWVRIAPRLEEKSACTQP